MSAIPAADSVSLLPARVRLSFSSVFFPHGRHPSALPSFPPAFSSSRMRPPAPPVFSSFRTRPPPLRRLFFLFGDTSDGRDVSDGMPPSAQLLRFFFPFDFISSASSPPGVLYLFRPYSQPFLGFPGNPPSGPLPPPPPPLPPLVCLPSSASPTAPPRAPASSRTPITPVTLAACRVPALIPSSLLCCFTVVCIALHLKQPSSPPSPTARPSAVSSSSPDCPLSSEVSLLFRVPSYRGIPSLHQ